ncbi:PKD domain-containing protein [Halorientalis brevis]|uniref:PKD domain-containing protein n=1 Tax=Halorientalis brevis TaxID=1126241 RepID=A0ABD6CDC1_9EURY
MGWIVLSTGVAYALPLAGIGGFTITAEQVTADNLLLYPGNGDTSELDSYPQTITELQETTLEDLTLTKTIDLGSTPGLSGKMQISFVSTGNTSGSSVVLKSSVLRSEEATFNDFSIKEMESPDAFGQFEIASNGSVTLEGVGSQPVQIRAHYLATNSISVPGSKLVACYDPDSDGDFEYGSCATTQPDWGMDEDIGGNQAPTPAPEASPNPIVVNETVTFDASASYDADGSISSYEWTFDDGTTSTNVTTSQTYSTPANYTVDLTVTDDDGATATETVTVTVESKDPEARPTANRTSALVGDAIAFDGTNSSDPDGSIVSYEWNFSDGGKNLTGPTVTHSFDAAGTYEVNLTVTDDDNITDREEVFITVDENTAPTANATANRTSVIAGDAIAFDGTNSSDSDGSISSYEWAFGDNSTATGPNVTHAYSSSGNYTATLTVTDDKGATATDTVEITVGANSSPTASATANRTSVDTGDTISFDGSGSSDSDGSISSYEWAFGDNSTATGANVTHAYSSSGNYTATLTVTDDKGATDSDTVEITVGANSAPTASATANQTTVTTSDTISFDGTGSSDSDGSISTYEWDFGDNTTTTGATPTYSYDATGNYTATLTVTDDDGATATDTLGITVESNAAPTANATANQTTATVNETIAFDGTGSSDSDGSISTYEWDFGDGTTTTGATPTHAYSSTGNYTVALTVTDDDGATATATIEISIT